MEDAEIQHQISCKRLEEDSKSQTQGDGYSSLEAVLKRISQHQDQRMDMTFSMSAPQSMRLSSAGKSNYQTELQAS